MATSEPFHERLRSEATAPRTQFAVALQEAGISFQESDSSLVAGQLFALGADDQYWNEFDADLGVFIESGIRLTAEDFLASARFTVDHLDTALKYKRLKDRSKPEVAYGMLRAVVRGRVLRSAMLQELNPHPHLLSPDEKVNQSLEPLKLFNKGREYSHNLAMARHAEILARRFGFAPEMCNVIRRAARRHDSFKVGVPLSILNSRASFKPIDPVVDFDDSQSGRREIPFPVEMWPHGAQEAAFLREIGLPDEAMLVAEYHDRDDGMGYTGIVPRPAAQIMSVADTIAVRLLDSSDPTHKHARKYSPAGVIKILEDDPGQVSADVRACAAEYLRILSRTSSR